MGVRKNLSIGVTVNLEHYENLRLEVNGEVETVDEANELVGFLDDVLGKFGREDPATAQRIDNYRKRVLPSSRSGTDGQVPVPPVVEPTPPPPETAGPVPPPTGPEPKVSIPVSDADKTCCETCGGDVTPAEQKMSRLFTGKTLCRSCMKKV